MLTIGDLGVLRDVTVDADGHVQVTVTPTYSGCPRWTPSAPTSSRPSRDAGFADAEVNTVLSPAWTTDWMSDEGKRKLLAYGIAPPTASYDERPDPCW